MRTVPFFSTDEFITEVMLLSGVSAGQVHVALGGIVNLYLEQLTTDPRYNKVIEVESSGLVPSFASKKKIIREIRHCTGLKLDKSETLLEVMGRVLKNMFFKHDASKKGDSIFLQFLGYIMVKDLEAGSYRVVFFDLYK